MTKTPEQLLALRFGGATVAENLKRATESGELIENDDGTLQLADRPQKPSNWVSVSKGRPLGCHFLMDFLFHNAYAQSAVPYGCRECYKVKVVPRTLRQLVAAWEIAQRIEFQSKWGIDFYNPHSQNIYAGYFYTSGLETARVLFKIVREAVNNDPKLGPDIAMSIKRGCSEYEAKVGPSDRYEFAPEMAELEAYLKSRFPAQPAVKKGSLPLAHWIDFAFRIGDDTYLDFTGGKRLRAKTVAYDP